MIKDEIIAVLSLVHLSIGTAKVQALEGSIDDEHANHLFYDKKISVVSINDGFIRNGDRTPAMHSYCEVYPTAGISTNVCFARSISTRWSLTSILKLPDYLFGPSSETMYIAEPTVAIFSVQYGNYYHYMTEFVPRLELLKKTFFCFRLTTL